MATGDWIGPTLRAGLWCGAAPIRCRIRASASYPAVGAARSVAKNLEGDMGISIPGLGTLYSILKRDIDVRNDTLAGRKQLSKELYDNCRTWAQVLVDTFDEAVRRGETEGKGAAFREMEELIGDFLKLDYYSLESSSPILQFLQMNSRFREFAESCARFYESALNVKRLVWGDIERHPGEYVSSNKVGIEGMIDLWKVEVEKMLRDVAEKYHAVHVIQPT